MTLQVDNLHNTMELMCKDMMSKGKVAIIAYYFRDPEEKDPVQPVGNCWYWMRTTTASHYDYVQFEKYVKDQVCNTYNS